MDHNPMVLPERISHEKAVLGEIGGSEFSSLPSAFINAMEHAPEKLPTKQFVV